MLMIKSYTYFIKVSVNTNHCNNGFSESVRWSDYRSLIQTWVWITWLFIMPSMFQKSWGWVETNFWFVSSSSLFLKSWEEGCSESVEYPCELSNVNCPNNLWLLTSSLLILTILGKEVIPNYLLLTSSPSLGVDVT